jgi:carbamoyl-phosphate synthase large subunit
MKRIIKALNITGPFNIQFLAKNNYIKVIECNLRASRSFPFVSKTTKYNFIEIATKAILGMDVKYPYNTLDLDYVAVKAPQFSFSRLKGADPRLGVEMASTGEVACFGRNINEAFLKSMLAVGTKIPKKNILITLGQIEEKVEFVSAAKKLIDMEYVIFATQGTHELFKEYEIESTLVHKVSSNESPNILDMLSARNFDMVINSQNTYSRSSKDATDGYLIRRKAVDLGIPLINNLKVAKLFVSALHSTGGIENLGIEEFAEYKKD